MVSLDYPQEVPESAFSTLLRLCILVVMLAVWIPNVSLGSNATPSILGVFSRGSRLPFMVTCGWWLSWALSGVKRVTDDF